ncbi:BTAD domain-containing putative transcriptional regulator [Streptomyces sp. MAA16]|uniref:AfsR/SARP family transcriptional regulator n=1 Tax=Streptomyces sp. MAA16 TaxID=3035116 RepID=UPI002474E498|nr:BTAD domain-containing putative transcriptional regulator [Streptomyces sp. MAA16]
MEDRTPASLRFSLLGPPRAWHAGRELSLGPPQQRALLTLLLLHRGRTVDIDALVDGVWGDAPPAGAVPVVRTYVSRLRKLLEPDRSPGDAFRVLVSAGRGYALRTDTVVSDLDEFEEAVAEARADRNSGELESCARLLRTVLAAWQGTPLAGVPGPYAQAARDRLTEQRLSALEFCLRVELDLGRHESVVTELVALRDACPLREGVSELLLIALARCGRKAEALEAYARTRRTLVRELGVEPGPSLRAVHAFLLADDPDLTPPPARRTVPAQRPAPAPAPAPAPDPQPPYPARPAHGVRPSQLPADSPLFTGRQTELAQADALLSKDEGPAAPVIGVIDGMAGAGKTTFAVHWAHQVAHRFPDGSLYVNLRGYDQDGAVMDPSAAIESCLTALGVPPSTVPEGLDAQAALYRSVLAGRRVLIVLDNARDTEQVRPLLPGTPGCLVIITSRSRLSGLVAGHGAHPLTLGLPSADEAHAMLVRRVGHARAAAEPVAADDIVNRCARLPLALAIVASRAARHPGFRLADIAAELRADHGSLDAFTGGDAQTDARAVFSWSYHALAPQAAALFRRLALHPGPDVTSPAAAALLGVDIRRARALLVELTGTSLIAERAPGRFVFHDLLRAYAAELADAEDSEDSRRAALRRLHDHYLHTAHHASLTLGPFRETIALPPALADSAPLTFRGKRQATAWLRAERHVLRAVIESAAAGGFEDHAWRTAFSLELYLDRLGYWHDLMEINRTALACAVVLGDRNGQAHAHRALGFSHTRFGQRDEARAHLERALRLFGETEDTLGAARAHRQLAFLANDEGDHTVALLHYREAHTLYLRHGHRSGEAGVLNEVGWTYILLGEAERALEHCEKAVALHQEIGDPNGEAAAQDSVGYAHHHLGHHDASLGPYRRALDLYREIGDRYLEADTLRHIGDAHHAAGRPEAAREAWAAALVLLEEAGHPDAEALRRAMRRQEGPPPR